MTTEVFDIYALGVGGGTLGLCPLPTRKLDFVQDWAPDLVISMVENHEMPSNFWREFSWRQVPVKDFGVPVDDTWDRVEPDALAILRTGGRVLIHCKGGCGRSGMAVLRLMLAVGEDDALSRLRAARPCAIETDAQLAWAKGQAG